jgi:hypothetical protein
MGALYCEDVDIAEAVPAGILKGNCVRPWAIDPEQLIFASFLYGAPCSERFIF